MKIESIIQTGLSIAQAPFEVVELKGRGHPDTICDLLVEQISYDLGHFYLQSCGQDLHYNEDKALLIGGTSRPNFGGGEDIKVMAIRRGKNVDAIITCAMVDQFINGVKDYIESKNSLLSSLNEFLQRKSLNIIPEYVRALEEVRRVLVPGGRFVSLEMRTDKAWMSKFMHICGVDTNHQTLKAIRETFGHIQVHHYLMGMIFIATTTKTMETGP